MDALLYSVCHRLSSSYCSRQ